MRRARIKAVATVPVRRKATQDGPIVENTDQAEKQATEKIIEETQEESVIDSTPTQVNELEPEIPIAQEATKVSTIPAIKDKDCLEIKIHDNNACKPNIEAQKIAKIDLQQKIQASCIEASPIKTIQSRSCFMRPTPRLDGGGRVRRNSIQGSGASASESEDDSRRSNIITPNHRVRNDSICSIQSLKETGNITNIAKLNLGQKRRMVVSESARKLAEARREFLLKHENKSPDKSKLTMYDLIYYNPTSNPMKPKPVTMRPSSRKISVCSLMEDKKEEELEDKPPEMLVPQVKVGPNGQLIIDEQSLVIDQYKIHKNIDRSDIVVDEDTTGNGFYKRRKKSKEWNKWETVKFYKALNTYGTDFLLMQSIFPSRTRQELKLKYKKEERLNRNLVEKALQYQEFNTETLQKDLASVEESERKESELHKITKDTSGLPVKKKRKRCQLVTGEINCENEEQQQTADSKNTDEHSSDENARITITRRTKKRTIRKRKGIMSERKSSLDECENDLTNNSDSDSEIYKIQPTRSGRTCRKTRKMQKLMNAFDMDNVEGGEVAEQLERLDQLDESYAGNNESDGFELLQASQAQTDEEAENQNELLEILGGSPSSVATATFEGIVDDVSDVKGFKPGSLVVLRKNSGDESGKTNLQIYVVSADYDNNPNSKDGLLPIDLSPDILETVTDCIKDIEPKSIPRECNVP